MELLLVLTFAALALCGETDDLDPKKRGVGKTVPSNQAEQYSYVYQQQPTTSQQSSQPGSVYSEQNQPVASYYSKLPTQSTGSNVYPPVPTNADAQSVYSNPPNSYNILPQQSSYYPIQFLSQSPMQSKIQLIPAKLVNGQIQIISQPSLLAPQIYPIPQTAYQTNAAQQSNGNHQYSASVPQTSAIPAQASYGGFPNQAPSPFYQHQSLVGQPSTMLILTQPVNQLYNNYLNQSPQYSNAGQQLLQYYQSNPQARYQLLYGGGSHITSSNYNNYQEPSADNEYDKPLPGPVTQKSENDLSVNEYDTPSDSNTSYKSTNDYATRGQAYKAS